jgi:protein-disulfide isomerase
MSKEESSGGIKNFFIPVLVILAIGLAFFSGTLWQKVRNLENGTKTTTSDVTEKTNPTVSLNTIKGLFDKDLIKIGNAKSKVIFVEIADPSCPYCHIADGNNPELAKSVGATFQYTSDGGTYIPPGIEIEKLVKDGKASYVYVYYPGHGNGEMTMKALYCANEKGKFWEAKALIMNNDGYELSNTTVQNDVSKAGTVAEFLKSVVDYNFMKSCLESDKYDSRLTSDSDVAVELGIQGTPSFYVNETNFPGAYSYKEMQSVVDAALK